ncbi:ABC transporter substrate-binding protein [Catellatospora sp. TT07R-123]|uniref:extracellular solute-binding protein n=1 Tax=Catellatospora sp. TT07R-123 TaxID=2733863 RepID=UPI001B28C50A|nr:extracellular solute-binding protein [Catellatospora sp. TT07R-123]GHJ45604.1 ABC transporter substrate-binding protein [Catellatospora sp. TT07R-123]
MAAQPPESPGKTVVEMWMNHWFLLPKLLDPIKEQALEFGRRHPEYEVRISGIDVRTMLEELGDAVAAGTGPQLVTIMYLWSQHARDMRLPSGAPAFQAIEEAIGGRSEILGEPVVVGDLVPNMARNQTIDGKLNAMPRNPSTTLMYANMTILREAGITEPPRTWQQIDAACEAVARLRGRRPSHAITWPNQGWFFEQAVAQHGGQYVDHDNGRTGRAEKIDLATPEMLSFVTWWQRLNRDGHFLYSGKQMDWLGCYDLFVKGEVAITLNSSVEAGPLVSDARDNGFEVVPVPFPYNEDVPFVGNSVAGDGIWLAAGLSDEVRDGALAFLQFLVAPQRAAAVHGDKRTFMPITESSLRLLEEQGWYVENPHERTAIDQLRRSADTPATRGAVFGRARAVQDVITEAMHDVLMSGADPVARFQQATAQAQQMLDEYNDTH